MDSSTSAIVKSGDEFQEFISEELMNAKGLLKDIILTLDQSQGELSRLTQKKASVTAQLQKVQNNLDSASKSDIRDAFIEAMDAQQRLLVMRGQLDKLQEQRTSLANFIQHLEKVQEYTKSNSGKAGAGKSQPGGLSTLEMLINSQEAERQKLSRQMHDGPAQALSNFIVQAEISTKMFDMDPTKSREELEKLKNSAMNTFQKVRNFISDLRPMMLDDMGLSACVKKHIASLKEETGVDISVNINIGDKKLPGYLEIYIFRAMQELIGNSIKHNQSNPEKIKVDVDLTVDNTNANLTITDNGQGFDPAKIDESGGLGLKLIRERAEMLGGSLMINTKTDSGVEIRLNFPLTEIAA